MPTPIPITIGDITAILRPNLKWCNVDIVAPNGQAILGLLPALFSVRATGVASDGLC